MPWAVIAVSALFGTLVGSFLNVCVYRLPRNQSVVLPPSRCLSCGTQLRWYDNLPVVGWLLLRGRCRWCGTRYGARYLGMELLVGALTAVVCVGVITTARLRAPALQLAGHDDPLLAVGVTVAALLTFVYVLLVSTLIDLEHLIVPDELTKSLQLAAPLIALGTGIGLDFPWNPGAWLIGEDIYRQPVVTSHTFIAWFGGSVAIAAAVLALSLPLARAIYGGSFLPVAWRWAEADHRGLRLGVWWFLVTLVPPTLVALLLAATMRSTADHLAIVVAVQLANAVLGAIVGWMVPYAVGFLGTLAFRRNAMGYADVKILAPIGAVLGPIGVLYAFFLAAVVGSIVGIPLRLAGRAVEIPFVPYLAIGAVAAAAFGPALHDAIFHGLAR